MQSDGQRRAAVLPEKIDLETLGHALWRRKFLIAGFTLLAVAIAFAVVNVLTPRYKSQARVLIETRENVFLQPDAERTTESRTTVDQEAVTRQVQVILSLNLAGEIIKTLKLAERPEFDPLLGGPKLWRTVRGLTGIIKAPMDMTAEERVFKSYYERLSAFQLEKSPVIAIEFVSVDPELAARAANAVAEGYLALQQAAKQEQTRAAGAWLSGEIDRLRTSVAQAESRLEQYRAKSNLFIGQMRAEAGRLARAIENDARVAGAKVERLTAGLDQLKRQAVSSNERDVQLRALERDAKSQRDLLESYLAKYREATAPDSIGAAAPDARIISRAVVSDTPSWPKKMPTIVLAAFGMFALTYGFILSNQLLGALPPPLSGMAEGGRVADVVLADRALHNAGRSAIAGDPIDALAGALGTGGQKRIAVVGTVDDADVAAAAIALARGLARHGRVVLIDLAFEFPGLGAISHDQNAPGLAELVAGTASFGDIIARDRASRLHVISAGREKVNTAAITGSPLLSITLEALERRYDHVVINAGKYDGLDRAILGAEQAVLVAAEHDHPATPAARQRLLDAGFSLVPVMAGGRLSGEGNARAAA